MFSAVSEISPRPYLTSLVVLISIYIFRKHIPSDLFQRLMNRYRFNGSRDALGGRRYGKLHEHKVAMANGGVIGGIANDGNTCFMNSVLQSLASSRELVSFIHQYSDETQPFTEALKKLLDDINGAYGTRGKEFSTRPLLNKMPNGPKQNFFSGYNQEDAQEFYQLVMGLVEREHKKARPVPKMERFEREKDVDHVDYSNLASIGTVCVPAQQVDPNLDRDDMVSPLSLVTPVDGVSVERIGCLTCGEVGGLRYAVNSGLSLNLPHSTSYYDTFQLPDLLDKWIMPEIIEDVNCNRCGLNQTRRFLEEKLSTMSGPLREQFEARLGEINESLRKSHIEDEVFEKLTIKQMTTKSKKSKQIYLSRPPPLLAIHINRSVFDPRTYSIVKNPSNVTFPAKLDLGSYVAEPSDVNMDARKAFRKQDEGKEDDSEAETESLASTSDEKNEEENTEEGKNKENTEEGKNEENTEKGTNEEGKEEGKNEEEGKDGVGEGVGKEIENDFAGEKNHPNEDTDNQDIELKSLPSIPYNLKAVVSHYGTHNYGHYICYRKHRGTWWRISDETVHVVREEEVLDGRGTFMVFYEFDDGSHEQLVEVEESESDKEQKDEEIEEKSAGSEDEKEGLFDRVVPTDADYHMGEERVHL